VHEVGIGGRPPPGHSAATLGLGLDEGKTIRAAVQRHLVAAQVDEHCGSRRRCDRCGAQRPLKDLRPRRLTSLFRAVEIRAPRFDPCRCGVACRRSLTPVAEIMPDRCTPEYERVVAAMGAALPYRCALALMREFFPLGAARAVATTETYVCGRAELIIDYATARRADLDGDHGRRGAVVAASPDGCRPADALVAEVRAPDAEGPHRRRERHPRRRSHRRRAVGPSAVPPSDVGPPRFWTVSTEERLSEVSLPLRRLSRPRTIPEPAGATPEVQLCVMVAPAVRANVRAAAKARGLTLRALVLSALRDAGVLEGLGNAEVADRRAALAAAKARLWREHASAATDAPSAPGASPPAARKFGGGGT
jgi:hypothetical protein